MKRIKEWIFPVLILVIGAILAYQNYVPGTILSGWDSLHPEFNIWLYFKRAFFGVWQEHQGVGAVASQSHTAEIPRLLVIWLESLVLPVNLVRYAFMFLCVFVGSLGFYFIAKYLLENKESKFAGASAFLASIFYVFNLTTIQQFYVPLEMFPIHFASIPWLFYWIIRYIRGGYRYSLIWFSVATILSSGMAHTATLYYVYIASLTLFLFSSWVLTRRTVVFKKSFIILALTLLLNSYWILPNLYFVKNHSQEVADSKIHSIFSGEAFLQSKNYGTLNDLILQKNFLFNWRAFDYSKNEFTDLLQEWKTHLERPYVIQIGYAFFALAVSGIAVALLRKSKYHLAFILPLILTIAFWINANSSLEPLFNYLRDSSLLFREGLRFPFTKFSIILVFILSLYLSLSFQFILKMLGKIKVAWICVLLVLAANIYFALPAFKGYFISPNMKVNIPKEYFSAFDWFSKQNPNVKIAKLPMNTMWGWNYYSWGYEGAGFTWFGIPQAIFDREFDRWSPYNEDFYSESSSALYGNDPEAFEFILKKYQVKYLLLDESIVNPGGDQNILFIPEIKSMLSNSKI